MSKKDDKKKDKKKKGKAVESATPTKIYLDPAEWGQIMATAWADPAFKEALESDPIPAIRKRFPMFEFERVLMISAPPPGITEDQLKRTAEGKEIVIPDVATGPHIYFHG
ncbi:MAG: hypothetical protein KDD89_10620 [Anaerolineales bacterium]|nr:hypothetical protein [Anaerolineales bacterium]